MFRTNALAVPHQLCLVVGVHSFRIVVEHIAGCYSLVPRTMALDMTSLRFWLLWRQLDKVALMCCAMFEWKCILLLLHDWLFKWKSCDYY